MRSLRRLWVRWPQALRGVVCAAVVASVWHFSIAGGHGTGMAGFLAQTGVLPREPSARRETPGQGGEAAGGIRSHATVLAEVDLSQDGSPDQTATLYDLQLEEGGFPSGLMEPLTVPVRSLQPLDVLPGGADSIRTRADWGRMMTTVDRHHVQAGNAISVLQDYGDSGAYSVYLVQGSEVRWLFVGCYEGLLWVSPAVRIVRRNSDEVPDILDLVPPLGLACWRWNGEAFQLAMPSATEAPTVLAMMLRAYAIWICVALAAVCIHRVLRVQLGARLAWLSAAVLPVALIIVLLTPYLSQPALLVVCGLIGLVVWLRYRTLVDRLADAFGSVGTGGYVAMLAICLLLAVALMVVMGMQEVPGWLSGEHV